MRYDKRQNDKHLFDGGVDNFAWLVGEKLFKVQCHNVLQSADRINVADDKSGRPYNRKPFGIRRKTF